MEAFRKSADWTLWAYDEEGDENLRTAEYRRRMRIGGGTFYTKQ
ncbi:hypothetical protein [Halobacillus litoralis]|nr:hypothetical protein [Halobacillus litoralis]